MKTKVQNWRKGLLVCMIVIVPWLMSQTQSPKASCKALYAKTTDAYGDDIDEEDTDMEEEEREHVVYVDEQSVVYELLEDNTCFVKGYTSDVEAVLTIPETITVKKVTYEVTKIGEGAFYECNTLENITLPSTITEIGDSAFMNCDRIEKIILPEGVKAIRLAAFWCCDNLAYLQIPKSVTEIEDILNENEINKNFTIYGYLASEAEDYAASFGKKFSVIGLEEDKFADEQGVIYSLKKNKTCSVSGYAKTLEGNVKIPAAIICGGEIYAVTEIDACAFKECRGAEEVWISTNVHEIGKDAFADCMGIVLRGYDDERNYEGDSTKVNRYAGENQIDYKTIKQKRIGRFTDTQGVKYILRNDGTCYVSGYAEQMESEIVIPETIELDGKSYFVTEIERSAFEVCTKIEKVTLPAVVTMIGRNSFEECTNLAIVNLPQSIYEIGEGAFKNCSKLEKIEIPENLKYIDSEMFLGCSSLKSIVLPETLKGFFDGVFEECISLTSIHIPANIEVFGGAFGGCENLTSISVDEENPYYCSDETGCIYNKDKTKLVACSPVITKLELPDTVTELSLGSFYKCRKLESFEIPENVKVIGDEYSKNIFAGCINLKDLSVSENNTKYSSDKYGNIYNKAKTQLLQGAPGAENVIVPKSVEKIWDNVFCECQNLKSITLSEGIKKLGNYAFQGCCSLKQISIPASLTEIGYGTFGGCENLTDISISSKNTKYTADSQGFVYNKKKTTIIIGAPAVKDVVISNSVTSIEAGAFSNNTKIESITIPDSVGIIYVNVFEECTNLKNVCFPHQGIIVCKGAFLNCRSLESLVFPYGAWLDDFAMLGCARLKMVKVLEHDAIFTEYSFDSYNDELVLYGYKNSLFEQRAKENSITFSSMGNLPKPKKNTILIDAKNKCKVKVTSASSKNPTVAYTKTTNTKAASISIPATVTIAGTTYKVTEVAASAFSGNKKLTKVTIGKNVKTIGKSAFKNCSKLKTITVKSSALTSVGSSALKGTNKKLVIKVPSKKVSNYKKLFKGKGNGKVTVKKA